jgi:hypothetical protein
MVSAWRAVGLVYQKKQAMITDAQWQLAEQNGFDHCQRQSQWRPVSDFSGARKTCDHCHPRPAAGLARQHNRYHYYDQQGQRLSTARPGPDAPAPPAAVISAAPPVAAPLAAPPVAAPRAAPSVADTPDASARGALGMVINAGAEAATAVDEPVHTPQGDIPAIPAVRASVTADEAHAQTHDDVAEIARRMESELSVNPPTPPTAPTAPTPPTPQTPPPHHHNHHHQVLRTQRADITRKMSQSHHPETRVAQNPVTAVQESVPQIQTAPNVAAQHQQV